jgi:hypothetical protein
MTIQQNIENKIAEVEGDATGEKGERLRRLAADAIYGGQTSQAWKDLLSQFASPNDPAQLARLTGEGDKGCPASPYLREARAYLISNITCGTPTFTTTTRGVDDILDKTLQPQEPNS